MVLPVIDEFGNRTYSTARTNGIKIGDIVEVTKFGDVYPTYRDAFMMLWGDCVDSFHNYAGSLIHDYIGIYGNRWIVKNLCVHRNTSNTVLLHLKDRVGRNMLIELTAVKKIKNCSPKIVQPTEIKKVFKTI